MLFLETADALKIEDILPLFPDFVMIDDFKEEICVALEDYSRHVDSLKNDMEEATRNAESIKADLGELRNRFITLGTSECCCHCEKDLYERQFYVFPCYHSIHVDCLINMVGFHRVHLCILRNTSQGEASAASTHFAAYTGCPNSHDHKNNESRYKKESTFGELCPEWQGCSQCGGLLGKGIFFSGGPTSRPNCTRIACRRDR